MRIKIDSGPALPWDDKPASAPERIRSICGTRWRSDLNRESPCGHVNADGVQTADVSPVTILLPKVKVQYTPSKTKKWQSQ
jgi:hypothetical protein